MDISAQIVSQFGKKSTYEPLRKDTTVKVFAKKILEEGDNYENGGKEEKLFDLEWNGGKFLIKK